jgi:hypothetical protein
MRLVRFAMTIAALLSFGLFAQATGVQAQRGDLHCEEFASQQQAQEVFEDRNSNLPELDPDGNGIACDDQDYVFRGDFKENGSDTPTPVDETPETATSVAETAVSAEPTEQSSTVAREPEQTDTALFEGDCSPGVFNDPIAFLSDPILPQGNAIGATPIAPVASSYSTVTVPLTTLTDSPHVLVVFDPDHPEQVVACGTIAGVLEADGSLAIALAPAGTSHVNGLAYLTPTDNGVGVSLFVVFEPDPNPATPSS